MEVLNETTDYYRYFDATPQVLFLFECVDYTIREIIPEEVTYLQQYEEMRDWLDDHYQMPNYMVALLMRFLEQNHGVLIKRTREREFKELTEEEVKAIEEMYERVFRPGSEQ